MKSRPLSILLLGLLLLAGACGSRQRTIRGTKIPETAVNRGILAAVESYRVAVENRDSQSLLLMASSKYWEDSGTPSGSDDYGFDGLRKVLTGRFQQAKEIRYAIRTMNVRQVCPDGDGDDLVAGCKAHVEVLIDSSYSIVDSRGIERRPDKRDQNELVLEWAGDKWLFLAGM